MSRFEKSEERKKLVRVPTALKRKLEEVIYKSRTVLAECPFGHDVQVAINIEYVPKSGPDLRLGVQIQRKRAPSSPRLVQSDEPVSDEYFEALLRLPLCEKEKSFIRLFQKKGNEPMSPLQWMREGGFRGMACARAINALCRRHHLGISFAETGEYDMEDRVLLSMCAKYKFYVLERPRKARE